jgi:hypothetical protein
MREINSFLTDHGHEFGHEYDIELWRFRTELEIILGKPKDDGKNGKNAGNNNNSGGGGSGSEKWLNSLGSVGFGSHTGAMFVEQPTLAHRIALGNMGIGGLPGGTASQLYTPSTLATTVTPSAGVEHQGYFGNVGFNGSGGGGGMPTPSQVHLIPQPPAAATFGTQRSIDPNLGMHTPNYGTAIPSSTTSVYPANIGTPYAFAAPGGFVPQQQVVYPISNGSPPMTVTAPVPTMMAPAMVPPHQPQPVQSQQHQQQQHSPPQVASTTSGGPVSMGTGPGMGSGGPFNGSGGGVNIV